jgi:GNAT superfamily N-acetyltransferase
VYYSVRVAVCVHRDHQRRGAGTLLMQWGLDHAQRVGLPAYLEASPFGYPLYLRMGLREIGRVLIKAEEWDGGYDKVYVAMLKQPQNVSCTPNLSN